MLFDLDDTLVNDKAAARQAVVAWSEALGLIDPNAGQRWAQISAKHYSRYQRRELTFAGQRRERVRDFLDRPITDLQADRLFTDYLKHYEAGWTVFGDTIATLRRARKADLAVAVLTNGDESQQLRKLERLALRSRIDLVVASSSLPAGKPDPRAFRHTLDLLGADASGALMVGDSLENDVLGAQAAGLKAVLLDREGVHAGLDVPRVRSLHDLVFTT